MPPRRSLADKQRYWALLHEGMKQHEAIKEIGISKATAQAWERDMRNAKGENLLRNRKLKTIVGPIRKGDLKPEPLKALDDFGYFRRRYFGYIASPWQEDAAWKAVESLNSDRREFTVINVSPGGGKTKFGMHLQAWMTARNRSIRGLIGSRTHPKAAGMSMTLRRALEATRPIQNRPDEVAAGRMFDADACLTREYGRFEPIRQDLWRQDQFVVAQYDDLAISEKESTWTAYGLESDFLGQRVDFAWWDDTITKKDLRTSEGLQTIYEMWDDHAETRLDETGSLFLVGQRLANNDLYSYCLSKVDGSEADDDDDEDYENLPDDDEPIDRQTIIEPEGSRVGRMYHHIVYPAHDESRCTGKENHRKKAKAWPEGCLLEPSRLPWRELNAKRRNNPPQFELVYQQRDGAPENSLVRRLWIEGGVDVDSGEEFLGCYEQGRALVESPDISGATYSILAVDPSPTRYWGLLWGLYHPESEQRFLMNVQSRSMTSNQFLDWDFNAKCFTGTLEEWYQDSVRIGRPIKHLIFERNAAQRFFPQSSTFKKWRQERRVSFYPHDTHNFNKNHDQLGIQSVAPHFQFGRWRLPSPHGKFGLYSINHVSELVNELTNYDSSRPDAYRNDLVMATWFFEWWLRKIAKPDPSSWPKKNTPTWIKPSGRNLRVVA